MSAAVRYGLKAADYRAKAEAAALAAASATLDRVRQIHEQAVTQWSLMAGAEELRARQSVVFLGKPQDAKLG